MRCPCGGKYNVQDTRECDEGRSVRRRRVCPICDSCITTYETEQAGQQGRLIVDMYTKNGRLVAKVSKADPREGPKAGDCEACGIFVNETLEGFRLCLNCAPTLGES